MLKAKKLRANYKIIFLAKTIQFVIVSTEFFTLERGEKGPRREEVKAGAGATDLRR